MTKTVVLVGAMDTKGADFAFVRDAIRGAGLNVLVVDFGVLGEPGLAPDVSRAEVAAAGGGDLARLRSGEHKDDAMATMAAGLTAVVGRLHREGGLDGILGMGGTAGTSIACAAMRGLPVGVPKLMVSTVGGGDVAPYAGTKDITFMPSVIDVAGLNRISRLVYRNAAGAIAGMVAGQKPPPYPPPEEEGKSKPLIAATMFGNTTAAVDRARNQLERSGFEVLVFHATGIGGRTMEDLVNDGQFQGVLDLTTTELADEVCGGVMSAGPQRGHAAPASGVPVVFAPGCLDMANFGAPETVPARYGDRQIYKWNPNVTLLRTSLAENTRIGEMLAAAANAATGPVALLWPLRGFSMLDRPGGDFWDPEADRACHTAVRANLKPSLSFIEVDANINDPQFADLAAETLVKLMTPLRLPSPPPLREGSVGATSPPPPGEGRVGATSPPPPGEGRVGAS
ncbi:MAG: UPF0261 family protein [Chloroflexi bacterium]|nr:MAG: UPF0261 family protein [Chloroflexota bacterium]